MWKKIQSTYIIFDVVSFQPIFFVLNGCWYPFHSDFRVSESERSMSYSPTLHIHPTENNEKKAENQNSTMECIEFQEIKIRFVDAMYWISMLSIAMPSWWLYYTITICMDLGLFSVTFGALCFFLLNLGVLWPVLADADCWLLIAESNGAGRQWFSNVCSFSRDIGD